MYLLSDSKDSVSLFDLASGAATAPPATADSSTRSQWLTHNAAARLAIRNHLPLAECAHFGQHRTAQALYDAVVLRYSSPATAALGRLLLPYLFPKMCAFATVDDLVSHLRASDAHYCAAVPAEDHFLSLDPTSLTIDLLEQHLLAAETSAVAVGFARGTPRPPFFEGCSPSPLAPSYASAAAADISVPEDVGAASASAKRRSSKGKGGRGGGGGSGGGGGGNGSGGGGSSGGGGGSGTVGGSGGSGGGGGGTGGSGGSGGGGTGGGGTGARRVGSGGGQRQQQQRWGETPSPQQLRIAAAALGASDYGTLPGTAPAEALHTFTLDSSASRCFFRDSTTLTPLPAPVPVRLGDPSGGPVVARSSTVLPCPADAMVTTTTPWGQRVSIYTCTWTGHHLATFTRRPGSSQYTLATEPSQVAASAQVSASGQEAASCSSRLLSRQTLLWHHRLGHPSVPCLRGMHSRLLVSSLPRSLPPQPPSPAPPCLPCVEGRQRAAPHSSSFPPTTAPLQTLHMDVKGQVVDVLIPWIRTVRLQLRERFGQDLPVMRLHSDRGGEFFSNLLREFCHREGILHSFTLPDSPQQNGIAERRIGLVMEVARTSMIHAATPHFLWPFAVQYTAPQLNLWPLVSLPGEVGDASVFRVWGSRAFVCDTSADKLSPCAIPCVFLGFVPDVPGWQFYHPTSRRVFRSHDVTFDESVPFTTSSPTALPLPCPRRSSLLPVAVDSGAARGVASGGAEPGGAEFEGAETGDAEPGGVETGGADPGGVTTGGGEPEGVESGGAASVGAESGGAEPQGAASFGGFAGASPSLSPQQLREWFVRRTRLRSGASGAGGAGPAGAGGPGVAAGAGVTGGTATTGPGGARTRGTGAAGTRGVEGTRAGDLTESGTTGAGGAGAGGAGFGGPGAGGAGVGGPGVGGAGAGGAGAVDPGGAVRPRPYFIPLLQQVLGTPPSAALTPPLLCPPPDQSQPPLQPASPLPAPPYTEQSGGLTERREPASRLVSPVRIARRVPRSRPPPVPGPHAMTLRPSSVPLRVPLPAPPESSLPEVPDPESDRARAASPTVSHLLATAVTDPYFESAAACALVAELLDFAAAYRLDYATALVAESESASPPSVGGTQWSLQRPVYGLRQASHEWCDTLRTTLAALGFAPSTADPSLFLRTDTSLSPFYVLLYVDDLVFATADTEALTLVKSELQKRHTFTDLGELHSYLGLLITRDRARCTITLNQSHMVHHVLQHFVFQFSSPQPTPLSTSHSLSAPPSDESVEPSGPYPDLVGCLISSCEAEIYAEAMAAQELRCLTYLLTDLGEQPHSPPVLYVDNKAMIALCQEHRLEHRAKNIALRYFLARELQQRGQLRLAYVATRANTADVFTKALPPGDHQRFTTMLGLVPSLPHLLTA
ncbi:unnamed protein product [Closterium sp. NIES-54]